LNVIKATISRTVRMNKNKDKTYIAEAWYCPYLPFFPLNKKDYELPGFICKPR
jgi:hypothetical protein